MHDRIVAELGATGSTRDKGWRECGWLEALPFSSRRGFMLGPSHRATPRVPPVGPVVRPYGKPDIEVTVRRTEVERAPLAAAVRAALQPVDHVLRIAAE